MWMKPHAYWSRPAPLFPSSIFHTDRSFIPLPHVAVLAHRAVGTQQGARIVHVVRILVVPAVIKHGVKYDVSVEINTVGRGIRTGGVVVINACDTVVIHCLVPLVLAGNDVYRTMSDDGTRAFDSGK